MLIKLQPSGEGADSAGTSYRLGARSAADPSIPTGGPSPLSSAGNFGGNTYWCDAPVAEVVYTSAASATAGPGGVYPAPRQPGHGVVDGFGRQFSGDGARLAAFAAGTCWEPFLTDASAAAASSGAASGALGAPQAPNGPPASHALHAAAKAESGKPGMHAQLMDGRAYVKQEPPPALPAAGLQGPYIGAAGLSDHAFGTAIGPPALSPSSAAPATTGEALTATAPSSARKLVNSASNGSLHSDSTQQQQHGSGGGGSNGTTPHAGTTAATSGVTGDAAAAGVELPPGVRKSSRVVIHQKRGAPAPAAEAAAAADGAAAARRPPQGAAVGPHSDNSSEDRLPKERRAAGAAYGPASAVPFCPLSNQVPQGKRSRPQPPPQPQPPPADAAPLSGDSDQPAQRSSKRKAASHLKAVLQALHSPPRRSRSGRSLASSDPWTDATDDPEDSDMPEYDDDTNQGDTDSGDDTPYGDFEADPGILSLAAGAAGAVAPEVAADAARRLPPGSASLLAEIPEEILPAVLAQTAKRRGKGGRQPAPDPRLDGKIDPKRAKRILANRQSAARSKLKQKLFFESLRAQQQMLAKQKSDAVDEARSLTQTCDQLRRENAALLNEVNRYRNAARMGQPLPPPQQHLLAPSQHASPAPQAAFPTATKADDASLMAEADVFSRDAYGLQPLPPAGAAAGAGGNAADGLLLSGLHGSMSHSMADVDCMLLDGDAYPGALGSALGGPSGVPPYARTQSPYPGDLGGALGGAPYQQSQSPFPGAPSPYPRMAPGSAGGDDLSWLPHSLSPRG